MKFVFVFLIIVGASYASLHDDFMDIVKVVPINKITEIADEHSKHDPEYQEVVAYMKGEEWHSILNAVNKQIIFQKLEKYLFQIGLDLEIIFDFIKKFIDGVLHPTKKGSLALKFKDENLRSFLDEIEEIIPTQKILAVVLYKLQTSTDFQTFYNQASSEQTKRLVDQTRKLPAVVKFLEKLNRMGVKVDNAFAVLYLALGWQLPEKKLK